MFSGSSCNHTTSWALGYRSRMALTVAVGPRVELLHPDHHHAPAGVAQLVAARQGVVGHLAGAQHHPVDPPASKSSSAGRRVVEHLGERSRGERARSATGPAGPAAATWG